MAKVQIDLLANVPLGRTVGQPPANEADHFIQCPVCRTWIDMRDLGQILEHEDKDCVSRSDTAAARKQEN
jgi:hypothetical protein